jgi:hypothetical protein
LLRAPATSARVGPSSPSPPQPPNPTRMFVAGVVRDRHAAVHP